MLNTNTKQSLIHILFGILIVAFLIVFVGAIVVVIPRIFLGINDITSFSSYTDPNALTRSSDRIALLVAAISAAAILAQLAGTFALGATLYTTFKTMQISQEAIRLTERQTLSTEMGGRSERFARAVDQIGAKDSSGKIARKVRTGGAFSLAMIAREDRNYYVPVLRMATDYVRENAKRTKQDHWGGKEIIEVVSVDEVAMLEIIRTRTINDVKFEREHEFKPSLRNAWLPAVDLSKGCLANLVLDGACLYQADLSGCDFEGTTLSNTRLDHVNLRGAKGLTPVQLQSAYTDDFTLLPESLSSEDVMLIHSVNHNHPCQFEGKVSQ